MNDLYYRLAVPEIVADLAAGRLSAQDLAQASIDAWSDTERFCRAWVCFDPDRLVRSARESSQRIARGLTIRPLEGVPIGVKDIFNTIEFPTQMGSPIWRDFTPGNDARVVWSCKQAGALVAGKTVTAEFAVHALNETQNPRDALRTPGTSSSGSAAAVATGMVPLALGTQTAGSIVRPASFCGVFGMKPTFGLLPRTGMLKTTDSLDTVGFLATRLESLRPALDTMRVSGPDYPLVHRRLEQDATQRPGRARGWSVAFAKTHVWASAHDYAQRAMLGFVRRLGNEPGVHVEEVALPTRVAEAHRIHQVLYDKSLAYYFQREYASASQLSDTMREMIERGRLITQQDFVAALERQNELLREMDDWMKQWDVLVSLATAGIAPLRGVPEPPDPSLIWTLTHLPVVVVPAFDGPGDLPFGVQVCARRYRDHALLAFVEELAERSLLSRASRPIPAPVEPRLPGSAAAPQVLGSAVRPDTSARSAG